MLKQEVSRVLMTLGTWPIPTMFWITLTKVPNKPEEAVDRRSKLKI